MDVGDGENGITRPIPWVPKDMRRIEYAVVCGENLFLWPPQDSKDGIRMEREPYFWNDRDLAADWAESVNGVIYEHIVTETWDLV